MITEENYRIHISELNVFLLLMLLFMILELTKQDFKIYYNYFDKYIQNTGTKEELIEELERLFIVPNNRQIKKIFKLINIVYYYHESDSHIMELSKYNQLLYSKTRKEICDDIKTITDYKLLLAIHLTIKTDFFHEPLLFYYKQIVELGTEAEKISNLQSKIISDINKTTEPNLSELSLLTFGHKYFLYKNTFNYLNRFRKDFAYFIINSDIEDDDMKYILYYIINLKTDTNNLYHFLELVIKMKTGINGEIIRLISELEEEQLLSTFNKVINYQVNNKPIEEEFGSYKSIIIDNIIKEVRNITEREYLLTIIFKIMYVKNEYLTIIDEFKSIIKDKRTNEELIEIISSEFLSEISDEELIILNTEINKVNEQFSRISPLSTTNICNRKKDILNNTIINYKKEYKTIVVNNKFNEMILKITDENVLLSIIYYCLKNYVYFKNDNKYMYIEKFFYIYENFKSNLYTLQEIILKRYQLKINKIQLESLIELLESNEQIIDFENDLKRNYYYIEYLNNKNNRESVISEIIEAISFDTIRLINPDINKFDINDKFYFIIELYLSLLRDHELHLNANFKKRLEKVINIIIKILEEPTIDMSKITLLKSLRGIPLIYMFYNIIHIIKNKQLIVQELILFIDNSIPYKKRLIETDEDNSTREILREANDLSDTIYGRMSISDLYENLMSNDNSNELKKLLIRVVYMKYIKKTLNESQLATIIKRLSSKIIYSYESIDSRSRSNSNSNIQSNESMNSRSDISSISNVNSNS